MYVGRVRYGLKTLLAARAPRTTMNCQHSLRTLCDLCVSAVDGFQTQHREDAENELTQREELNWTSLRLMSHLKHLIDHRSLIRMAQLVAVLAGALSLKSYYSTATVNQLRWILAPTTTVVEIITGSRFHFEAHAGYMKS